MNALSTQIIEHWQSKFPGLQDYFQKKNINGLMQVCETVSKVRPEDQDIILSVTYGFISLYFYQNTGAKKFKDLAEKLIKPVLDIVVQHIQSPEYRKYLIKLADWQSAEVVYRATFEHSNTVKEIRIKRSERNLLNYIKKTEDFPVLPKDIKKIAANYDNWLDELYIKSKRVIPQVGLKGRIAPEKLEELYINMDQEGYVETTKEHFIAALQNKPLPADFVPVFWKLRNKTGSPNTTILRAFIEIVLDPESEEYTVAIPKIQPLFCGDRNTRAPIKLSNRGDKDIMISHKRAFLKMLK